MKSMRLKVSSNGKDKHIWIVYALNRKTKEVVSYNVGARTNATLDKVIKTLRLSGAKKIFTDGWRGYKSLIDDKIHSVANRGTNHIERHNLTLRTHLKRLTRRTICFGRSIAILSAILKIYFWGVIINQAHKNMIVISKKLSKFMIKTCNCL